MTLFAGIISRSREHAIPPDMCERLAGLVSRDPADKAVIYRYRNAFFANLDIGAFKRPAEVADEQSLTLVSGEPLIGPDRLSDTRLIHDALERGSVNELAGATGVFSAVHYSVATGELTLATDKLGIRPVYYWIGDEYIIFSGALRILEELAEVPKVMDVRAITEIVGLGYALADRTPYAGIKMLRAAEVLSVSGGSISKKPYWKLDKIETVERTEEEHLSILYSQFQKAVERRNGSDTATSAYLSGGLDSRCIVAALRDIDVSVHTYNFARPNTQDLVYGREFAREAGSIHREIPKASGDMVPDFSQLMASGIAAGLDPRPERPAMVWSGEGGSVALGHVHLSAEMAAWMRNGETDSVIAEYIRRESAAVAPKLFAGSVSQNLSGVLENGIRSELQKLNATDPARNFYLFLLTNDQHRKLARHFENIDLHRLELQLPFFDSLFLETIISIPVDICLRHNLYVKWLGLLPAAVMSVPWQAYPGHVPCPVPATDKLAYQWADTFQTSERSSQKRREAKSAADMLGSPDFPREVLNRRNLRLATMVHRTGWRNYQYLIGPAETFYSYAQKCGGKYALPDDNR